MARSALYLNFADDLQRDFTARLATRMLARAGLSADTVRQLENRPVRGWTERRRGPLVNVWRPEQVEILESAPDGAGRRRDPPNLLADLAGRPAPMRDPGAARPTKNAPAARVAPGAS